MSATDTVSLAFEVIRQYAVREGWQPIGWRTWHVGPWTITVNGTPQERDTIPPYHALIQHDAYLGLMLISPFGGLQAGWKNIEDEFIAALQRELEPR